MTDLREPLPHPGVTITPAADGAPGALERRRSRALIRLGDESITVTNRQIELLLFFDNRGTAPHRLVHASYDALLAHGLIEPYTRGVQGGGIVAYRITDRGHRVADLLAPRDGHGRPEDVSGTTT